MRVKYLLYVVLSVFLYSCATKHDIYKKSDCACYEIDIKRISIDDIRV
jgi:hypothetical protein